MSNGSVWERPGWPFTEEVPFRTCGAGNDQERPNFFKTFFCICFNRHIVNTTFLPDQGLAAKFLPGGCFHSQVRNPALGLISWKC